MRLHQGLNDVILSLVDGNKHIVLRQLHSFGQSSCTRREQNQGNVFTDRDWRALKIEIIINLCGKIK